jgi:exodeoxyribonuclease VII large subunit
MTRRVAEARDRIAQLWRIAGNPRRLVEDSAQRLDDRAERLAQAMAGLVAERDGRYRTAAAGLRPRALALTIAHGRERVRLAARGLVREGARALDDGAKRLGQLTQLLASYSYESVLARGFAVVRDGDGRAIMAKAATHAGQAVDIAFHDGAVPAVIGRRGVAVRAGPPLRRGGGKGDGGSQGSLL